MSTPTFDTDIIDRLSDIADRLEIVDLAINGVVFAHGDPKWSAGAGLADATTDLRRIADGLSEREAAGETT
jgi:hypothetical protein